MLEYLKERAAFHELRHLGIRIAKIHFCKFTEGFKFVWPDVGHILFLKAVDIDGTIILFEENDGP